MIRKIPKTFLRLPILLGKLALNICLPAILKNKYIAMNFFSLVSLSPWLHNHLNNLMIENGYSNVLSLESPTKISDFIEANRLNDEGISLQHLSPTALQIYYDLKAAIDEKKKGNI